MRILGGDGCKRIGIWGGLGEMGRNAHGWVGWSGLVGWEYGWDGVGE